MAFSSVRTAVREVPGGPVERIEIGPSRLHAPLPGICGNIVLPVLFRNRAGAVGGELVPCVIAHLTISGFIYSHTHQRRAWCSTSGARRGCSPATDPFPPPWNFTS